MSPRLSFVIFLAASALFAIGCSSPSTPSTPSTASGDTEPSAEAVTSESETEAAVPSEVAEVADPTPATPPEAGPAGHFTVVTDEHTSTIGWTAIKNGDLKVAGEFTRITGGLFLDPADLSKLDGSLEAHLGSIDSKNPVRDANISELLFSAVVGKPSVGAVEILEVTPQDKKIDVGGSTTAKVAFNLGLPSGAVRGEADVTLSRHKDGLWKVTSSKPIVLSLKELSLSEESSALRERCAHESIGDRVELRLGLNFVARPTE